jgi:putative membrane protein
MMTVGRQEVAESNSAQKEWAKQMEFTANILVSVVVFFHIWFFVLERFIWNMPLGQKIFHMTAERAEAGSLLAANQGVYNLVLALGLVWALISKDQQQATTVKLVLLITIILVGTYGGVTVGRNVIFMQVIPAIAALVFVILAIGNPRINDVTTSFSQPPKFKAHAVVQTDQNYAYPPEFAADQKSYYESVMPLMLAFSPQQAFAFVDRALLSFPSWEIINKDPVGLVVEGSASTQFLRFTDDFVIEVRPVESGAEIHMRSRSRVGKSDFGVNAKRITSFLSRVQAISRVEH